MNENVDSGYPSEITVDEIQLLISLRLLVPKRFSACIDQGITSEARSYSDVKITRFEEIQPGLALIGSAVDYAQVGDRSSFVGPKEIRKYLDGLAQDIGNVAWFTSDNIETYGARVSYCMYLCRIMKSFPIVIGGDHSITKFCFREVTYSCNTEIGLIHFDAHNDLGDIKSENNLDNLMHSNVISHISEMPCSFIAQVGVRDSQLLKGNQSIDTPLYQLQDSLCEEYIDFLDNVENIHANTPIYLSIDIDCLNPTFAREVAAPLGGGISDELLVNMVDYIFRRFDVVGMDIVEVCGSETKENNAAKSAARVIEVVNERFK